MSASMAAAKLPRQRGVDEPVEMAVLLFPTRICRVPRNDRSGSCGAARDRCSIKCFSVGFSGGNPSYEETERAALTGTIGLKRLVRNFLKTNNDA